MKIIAINSSNRRSGNTDCVIRLMERRLRSRAAAEKIELNFEYVSLGMLNIQTCRGCRVCFDLGEEKCPLKDDLLELRNKLLEADGFIMGSPVYVEDVNGIMKNFIDRMAFSCHRPAFSGKSAVIFTTSAQGSTKHSLRTMYTALGTWGARIISQQMFRMGALMDKSDAEKRLDKKYDLMADRLFDFIKNNNAAVPTFYSLMIFKIQQMYWEKEENQLLKYDYEYWKNNGWLHKHCKYYISHKANPLKCLLARLTGILVAAFFI